MYFDSKRGTAPVPRWRGWNDFCLFQSFPLSSPTSQPTKPRVGFQLVPQLAPPKNSLQNDHILPIRKRTMQAYDSLATHQRRPLLVFVNNTALWDIAAICILLDSFSFVAQHIVSNSPTCNCDFGHCSNLFVNATSDHLLHCLNLCTMKSNPLEGQKQEMNAGIVGQCFVRSKHGH